MFSFIFNLEFSFNDRVSQEGEAIGSVRPSVCPFALYHLNRLTFQTEFLKVYGS